MGPARAMTDTEIASTSPSLVIPKLCDDGTNWADYEPRARRVMGSKGLVAHLEGRAKPPAEYIKVNDVPMVSTNPDVPATDEQLEAKEKKLSEYEQREYLAQHLILSSTSAQPFSESHASHNGGGHVGHNFAQCYDEELAAPGRYIESAANDQVRTFAGCQDSPFRSTKPL